MHQFRYLTRGEIRLVLKDRSWYIFAPACVMTPPGFSISDNGDGRVLIMKQEVLWKAFEREGGAGLRDGLDIALCVQFSDKSCRASCKRGMPVPTDYAIRT
jgi:hypothetical protein